MVTPYQVVSDLLVLNKFSNLRLIILLYLKEIIYALNTVLSIIGSGYQKNLWIKKSKTSKIFIKKTWQLHNWSVVLEDNPWHCY